MTFYFNRNEIIEESSALGDLFTGFGFAESIAEESKEAGLIKNNTPIMVVLGNPPYSVNSLNKGKWILNLIDIYKKGLNEQNINSLSDDYVKFIRFAESFVEKTQHGIVAMITNNSFIDGLVHRQMRKHLLETFDDIYIFNLHGYSTNKRKTNQISVDQNVFDITQGVSINIFVKSRTNKNNLANVYHSEIYGNRKSKFKFLNDNDFKRIKWIKIDYSNPYYFFVPKNFSFEDEYNNGICFKDLFIENGSGIKFRKDSLLIKNHFTIESVKKLFNDMTEYDENYIHSKYNFSDTADWKLKEKRKLFIDASSSDIKAVQYRPFDFRFTYYPLNKINVIIPRGDSRKNLMKHFLVNKNIGLVTKRGQDFSSAPCFITQSIIDMRIYSPPGVQGTDYLFPLYLYSEDGSKVPNLKNEIVVEIENIVEKTTPEDILDYIYAVLHSPAYRAKYKEFLKIDFPRVPYPKDKKTFNALVSLGTELRLIHLLESPKVNRFITTFPVMEGDEEVEKIKYENSKVWINKLQYFGNVPEVTWNFYIGGYQPAQKWLKDRKGRNLTDQDIVHYQKIIVALYETDRLMKEIDKIKF